MTPSVTASVDTNPSDATVWNFHDLSCLSGIQLQLAKQSVSLCQARLHMTQKKQTVFDQLRQLCSSCSEFSISDVELVIVYCMLLL